MQSQIPGGGHENDRALAMMARIGNSGRNPQNCERDLHSLLRPLLKLTIHSVSIPVQNGSVDIPVIFPHECRCCFQCFEYYKELISID